MKITAITLMMLHFSALAYCESERSDADRTVTVCLASGTLSGMTISRAKMLASNMLGEIGVSIDWQRVSHTCPAVAIRIGISESTPESLKPGALAYALPYEGKHIQVFYDRIKNVCEVPMTEIVLAHVLVHEITHILEGIERHSEQGVMKAKWDRMDFFHMEKGPLQFTPEDIDLIHEGLAGRRKLAILAMTRDQSGTIAGR